MATRFYLPAAGGATPPISPAIDGTIWEHVNTSRRMMRTTKTGTAIASTAYAPDAADDLTDKDSHFVQFISDFLEAQTISGTWKLQVRAAEDNAGNNLLLAVRVYVVSGDGTTIRATLQAITRDSGEVNTSLRNKSMSGSISSYTCIRGDRLVFEFGLGGTPTAAGGVQGHNGTLSFGDPFTTADLPEDETTTTALCPWFEFSGTVSISPYDATINGFEQGWLHHTSTTGLAFATTTASSVHSGSYGLRVNLDGTASLGFSAANANFDANGDVVNSNVPGVWDTFYMKVHQRPTTNPEMCYIFNQPIGRKAELQINASGNLLLINNAAATVYTTTMALTNDTWYRIDCAIYGNTASNGVWTLTISDDNTGATLETSSGTGQNFGTGNHAAGYCGKFVNRNSENYQISFDDAVRCVGAFAPSGKLAIVRPQSDGTTGTGWADAGSTGSSAASELQDDPAGINTDTTDTTIWVSTTAGGERRLTFGTLASVGFDDASISRIVSVLGGARVRDVGGASSMRVRMQISSSTLDKALHDPGATYIGRFINAEYDISTGGIWTSSAVNSIEYGFHASTNIEVRASVAKLEVLLVQAQTTIVKDIIGGGMLIPFAR